jgi:Uma2 family endonuclease
MKPVVPRERRWTRTEYDRLIEVGILHEDEPVELLAGHLVVAEPQNTPHARAIELTADALRVVFGPGWRVRVQLPLALGHHSEPEPDVVVVRGTPRAPEDDHPSQAALVIEVGDASLSLDRTLKAGIYAHAGVADYWIVNLVDRVLEVYREPGREGRRWRYLSTEILGPEATVRPLAAPAALIPVADLLP